MVTVSVEPDCVPRTSVDGDDSEVGPPRSGVTSVIAPPRASFVQFTDLHLLDAQSPARVEFLHPFIGSAHRPHETLSTHGATALVKRVNGLAGGPYTGRAFDFVL